MLWVRSQRYANRMVRVGRLLVAFRGEYAEIPEWAARERDWMVKHLPGVFAAQTPREVFGVGVEATAATRSEEVPPADPGPTSIARTVDEEPREGAARTRPAPRRGR